MKQLREGFSLHFVVAEPHQSNCEQYEVKCSEVVAGYRGATGLRGTG